MFPETNYDAFFGIVHQNYVKEMAKLFIIFKEFVKLVIQSLPKRERDVFAFPMTI